MQIRSGADKRPELFPLARDRRMILKYVAHGRAEDEMRIPASHHSCFAHAIPFQRLVPMLRAKDSPLRVRSPQLDHVRTILFPSVELTESVGVAVRAACADLGASPCQIPSVVRPCDDCFFTHSFFGFIPISESRASARPITSGDISMP